MFSKVASLVGMLRNRLLSSSSFPSYFFEEEEEGRVKHRGPEIFHGNMEPNTKEGETKEAERAKKKRKKKHKKEQVPMKRVLENGFFPSS